MALTTSSMHLKALSCKDLKALIPFQKPSTYAVVCIGDGGDRSPRKENSQPRQQQRTPIDRSAGLNPEWNQEMRFDVDLVPEGGLFLEFDIFSEGFLLLGDKLLGEVRVPLRDLVAEEEPSHRGSFKTVSYQVKAADGKSGGVLTFTYRTFSPPITLQQQHQYSNGREFPRRYPDLDDILSTGGFSAAPAEAPVGPDYFPPPPVMGYYPSFSPPAMEQNPSFVDPPPLPPPDPVFHYPPPPPPDPVFHYPPPPPPNPGFYYPPPPPPNPVFHYPPPPPPDLGFHYPPPPSEAYRCESWACDCPLRTHSMPRGQPHLSDMDACWGGRT